MSHCATIRILDSCRVHHSISLTASHRITHLRRNEGRINSIPSILSSPATRHNDQVALLAPRSLSPIGHHHHTYHPCYTAYSSSVSISFHPTFLFIERVHLGRNVSCGETKRGRERGLHYSWPSFAILAVKGSHGVIKSVAH